MLNIGLYRFIQVSVLAISVGYYPAQFAMENNESTAPRSQKVRKISKPVHIMGESLDELVVLGIQHISVHGKSIEARAGAAQQSSNVNYTLVDPCKRIHLLRAPVSVQYFCRELLAYFNGSLKVQDGLAQASSMWKRLANAQGEIASNYGYYVFHQPMENFHNKSQYEWVIACLSNNLDSRKAFININQLHHKVRESKDFPCTIGMQFFVEDNDLCCIVSSRSTDVYTGLPYDMGFFAFVTELVFQDLKERLPQEQSEKLQLGYVTMRTSFTQIYDRTRDKALALLQHINEQGNFVPLQPGLDMPVIDNAQATLQDIYQGTCHTPVMRWIYEHAA